MADIVYCYNDEVYFNLTNKCPCNCTFCIRNNGDSVGEAKTLWFDKEPTMGEIYKAIDAFDFSGYKEAVFCGYGEPTMALDKLIAVSEYMKQISGTFGSRWEALSGNQASPEYQWSGGFD